MAKSKNNRMAIRCGILLRQLRIQRNLSSQELAERTTAILQRWADEYAAQLRKRNERLVRDGLPKEKGKKPRRAVSKRQIEDWELGIESFLRAHGEAEVNDALAAVLEVDPVGMRLRLGGFSSTWDIETQDELDIFAEDVPPAHHDAKEKKVVRESIRLQPRTCQFVEVLLGRLNTCRDPGSREWKRTDVLDVALLNGFVAWLRVLRTEGRPLAGPVGAVPRPPTVE